MAHYIFIAVVVFAVLLPTWFVITIWHERVKHGWGWINKDSRTMYVDAIKAVASASAIAVSLVSTVTSTARETLRPAVATSVKFSVVSLILSIVGAIFTILALSRSYERSRSRFQNDPRRSSGISDDQGELNRAELAWILASAWVGLIGFLLGFLFIGRIVFQG